MKVRPSHQISTCNCYVIEERSVICDKILDIQNHRSLTRRREMYGERRVWHLPVVALLTNWEKTKHILVSFKL